MKRWFGFTASLFLLFSVSSAHAFSHMGGAEGVQQAESAGKPSMVSGKVVETMNAGGYTYVLLDNSGDRIWVACPEVKVKVGEVMFFSGGSVMEKFESKTLNKTFDKIVFSKGPITLDDKTKGGKGGKAPAAAAPPKHVAVEKAKGANAYTVSELHEKAARLDKKEVVVKATVVKFSYQIMDKNWLHLQDGSGVPEKGTHDIVATTSDKAAVGDVVTVTGTLAKDKDFGAGYTYDAILEDARISK